MISFRRASRCFIFSSWHPQPTTAVNMMGARPGWTCPPIARVSCQSFVGGSSAAAFSTTPFSDFKGPSFVRRYLQLLETRPIATKSLTAAAIFFLADATSQGLNIAFSDRKDTFNWDFPRSLRMLAAGLLLSGPSLHFWFNLMSATFPNRDIASTLKKMALGQIEYGPTFNTVFFSLNAYLQGETTPEVIARLKRDLLPALKGGLIYWPLIDFLTYRYVPVHLQTVLQA